MAGCAFWCQPGIQKWISTYWVYFHVFQPLILSQVLLIWLVLPAAAKGLLTSFICADGDSKGENDHLYPNGKAHDGNKLTEIGRGVRRRGLKELCCRQWQRAYRKGAVGLKSRKRHTNKSLSLMSHWCFRNCLMVGSIVLGNNLANIQRGVG